MTQGGGAIWLI